MSSQGSPESFQTFLEQVGAWHHVIRHIHQTRYTEQIYNVCYYFLEDLVKRSFSQVTDLQERHHLLTFCTGGFKILPDTFLDNNSESPECLARDMARIYRCLHQSFDVDKLRHIM